MNILIYNEGVHDREPAVKAVYPDGLHGALASIFDSTDNVRITTLETVEADITPEALENTDVLIWWGHMRHGAVPDSVVSYVTDAVQRGMGFIALHSAHASKPFTRLLGTPCSLGWRDNDRERVWTASPSHPIAKGVPAQFVLEHEEMYCEPFDIPAPSETVFISWFAGGEVVRSGVTFRRGAGKIFYFRPGHETFPTYHDSNVRRVIKNAAEWAKPDYRSQSTDSVHMKRRAEDLEG